MTTREVAEALGVTERRIQQIVKSLGFETQNGVASRWNEEQCTAISERLHNPEKLGPKSGETDLEINYEVSQTATVPELHSAVRNIVSRMDIKNEVKVAADVLSDLLVRFGDQTKELEAVREEADTLRVEADLHNEWYTVFKMQQLNDDLHVLNPCELGKVMSGIARKMSKQQGTALETVMRDINSFTGKYETIHSYHISVWKAVYPDANYSEGAENE